MQNLAIRLRSDGVDAHIDQWTAIPGAHLPAYMESAVRDSSFVLVVCTPNYRMKADSRGGGVGYEGDIITGEVLTEGNHTKFIPILRQGTWKSASPSWMRGKIYIDLSGTHYSEEAYARLLDTLFGQLPQLPKLGTHNPQVETNRTDLAGPLLTIVIPMFNEEQNLSDLFRSLRSEGLIDRYPIILCDDGSTDNTYTLASSLAARCPGMLVVRQRFNTRKVGAIDDMVKRVTTPFILTLDADCSIREHTHCAIDELLIDMHLEEIDATYFRITPIVDGWLAALQAIDYAIFTDSLRKLLKVPLCLIGQGVIWRRETLVRVLGRHRGEFEGDDLENTVHALADNARLRWEPSTVTISTKAKPTIVSLLKQRALSWDYGLLRVLISFKSLRLSGESAAFYRNILLADFLAHPLRLAAIPLLMSVLLFNFIFSAEGGAAWRSVYSAGVVLTLQYGAIGILWVWVACIFSSALAVRNFRSTLRWSVITGVYLSSPFAYLVSYPILSQNNVSAAAIISAASQWMGLGLFVTYLWWLILTAVLFVLSSLDRPLKLRLAWSLPFAPVYYLILLVISKTIAIIKFITRIVLRIV